MPKRIKDEDIIKIKETYDYAKERKKHFTVKNTRKRTKIKSYSNVTMNRYINKSCGKRKNLKHTQPKGGDVSWKPKLRPFQLRQIDIKHLTDIDNLKPYFNKNNDRGLAKYQITARAVATGFSIVAYCNEKASTYTKMFLEKYSMSS